MKGDQEKRVLFCMYKQWHSDALRSFRSTRSKKKMKKKGEKIGKKKQKEK